MDNKIQDIEKSNQYISLEFDSTKSHIKSAEDDLKRLNKQCKEMKSTIENLKEQNQNIENKTNDLMARSMRENLLFHGITETVGKDCENLVKTFIKDQLNIKEEITTDRTHRIGKPKMNKNRPVVAKFHYYKQTELVRNKAFETATAYMNVTLVLAFNRQRR